jgi:hypothetical protein
VQNHVDFSSSRNLITVGATLTVAAGDLTLKLGGMTLGASGLRRLERSCSTICSARAVRSKG